MVSDVRVMHRLLYAGSAGGSGRDRPDRPRPRRRCASVESAMSAFRTASSLTARSCAVLRARSSARRTRSGEALPARAHRPRVERQDQSREGVRLDPAPRSGGGSPRDEIDLYPTNAITIEPRRVIMNGTAQKTKRLLEKHGVEVITVEYDEVHKYGGRIRCNTMHLIRDKGPMTFA